MDPSKVETPEDTDIPKGSRERPPERARWTAGIPTKRTLRALLGVEAVSFLVAALIHAGLLVEGYVHYEAMIAESVIGTVLVAGLAMTRIRPQSMFAIAAGVQAFALLGTLVGIWTMIVGVGPRTVPDIAYHAAILVVLVAGLGLAWQASGTGSTRAEP